MWLFKQFEPWFSKVPSVATGDAEAGGEAEAEVETKAEHSSRVLWLHGAAGLGKTTVMAMVAKRCAQEVLGHHFCRHDVVDRRCAYRFVFTLAFQLAQTLPAYRVQLNQKLSAYPASAPPLQSLDLDRLFEFLLIDPLSRVEYDAEKFGGRRPLILIDGLDEASSPLPAHQGRPPRESNPILYVISKNIDKLPAWLGVVISSVRTPVLAAELAHLSPFEVELSASNPDHLQDLRNYVSAVLPRMLAAGGLSVDDAINITLEKVNGHFLTARLVLDPYLDRRLSPTTDTVINVNAIPSGFAAVVTESMRAIHDRLGKKQSLIMKSVRFWAHVFSFLLLCRFCFFFFRLFCCVLYRTSA
jgi:hypothetical protein